MVIVIANRLVFTCFYLFSVVGLEEELVDCSGGEDINLEAGTQRKLQALTQVSLMQLNLSRDQSPK